MIGIRWLSNQSLEQWKYAKIVLIYVVWEIKLNVHNRTTYRPLNIVDASSVPCIGCYYMH